MDENGGCFHVFLPAVGQKHQKLWKLERFGLPRWLVSRFFWILMKAKSTLENPWGKQQLVQTGRSSVDVSWTIHSSVMLSSWHGFPGHWEAPWHLWAREHVAFSESKSFAKICWQRRPSMLAAIRSCTKWSFVKALESLELLSSPRVMLLRRKSEVWAPKRHNHSHRCSSSTDGVPHFPAKDGESSTSAEPLWSSSRMPGRRACRFIGEASGSAAGESRPEAT